MLMTCVCVSNFIDVTYLESKTQVMKPTLEYNYASHFQYSNDNISTDGIASVVCYMRTIYVNLDIDRRDKVVSDKCLHCLPLEMR